MTDFKTLLKIMVYASGLYVNFKGDNKCVIYGPPVKMNESYTLTDDEYSFIESFGMCDKTAMYDLSSYAELCRILWCPIHNLLKHEALPDDFYRDFELWLEDLNTMVECLRWVISPQLLSIEFFTYDGDDSDVFLTINKFVRKDKYGTFVLQANVDVDFTFHHKEVRDFTEKYLNDKNCGKLNKNRVIKTLCEMQAKREAKILENSGA